MFTAELTDRFKGSPASDFNIANESWSGITHFIILGVIGLIFHEFYNNC